MTKMLRDAFWDTVYDMAREDRSILVVSADFGAPSLDKFREQLALQYIDVGIAEQHAVSLAAGLALGGKKVFAYAIAPFITLRCYEQTRINLASMKLPVTLVGVGAGVSYDDSGPTHHTVDDLSIMRILPNFKIYNASDATMAAGFARIARHADCANYVRLDRKEMPDLYAPDTDFSRGVHVLRRGGDVCLAATGNMVHRALDVAEELDKQGKKASVVDVSILPVAEEPFLDAVKSVKKIYTLEEHNLAGGFGSAVCEVVCDAGLSIPIKRFAMDFRQGYCYQYGGRDRIQELYGLDKAGIVAAVARDMKH
jgi:transketolase